LRSDAGDDITLSDLRGRTIILYFYPRDDTPGCTKQASGLRDVYGELQERGATVLGVSPDTEASHVKFREKYGLPFPLLADPDHQVAELYGVWVEKNMYGKKSMGIKRSTFVIDEAGNVAKAMRGVSPEGHADKVLAALP
jgi:peroxiredoxin Q/BCP